VGGGRPDIALKLPANCYHYSDVQGGVHLRALSVTPESIVKVYLSYGKTTSSSKVCGFLCSGGQRLEVHPPCIYVRLTS